MVIDKIENLQHYASLNPYFPQIIEFIKNTDLNKLENGKHEIDGKNCFVNIMDTAGKTKEEAVMETHKNMLDIQIPLNNDEIYGYTPTELLPECEYNAEKDATKISRCNGRRILHMPSRNDGYFLATGRTPALYRHRDNPQGSLQSEVLIVFLP